MWALCGYWGGPKKVVYNSEPDASDIEDGARTLVDAFANAGLTSVDALRRARVRALNAVREVELEPKLRKRIRTALEALFEQAEYEKALALPCTTIDQRRFTSLCRQAARLAPAAQRVRGIAIDSGMY